MEGLVVAVIAGLCIGILVAIGVSSLVLAPRRSRFGRLRSRRRKP